MPDRIFLAISTPFSVMPQKISESRACSRGMVTASQVNIVKRDSQTGSRMTKDRIGKVLSSITSGHPHSDSTSHPACWQLPVGFDSLGCSGQVLWPCKQSALDPPCQGAQQGCKAPLTVCGLSLQASQLAHELPMLSFFFLL